MRNKLVWGLAGMLLAAVANWQWPFLRFTNHWANAVAGLLAACLPLVLVGIGIIRVNTSTGLTRWGSVPLTVALLLLSLPSLLVVGFLAFSLPPFGNEQDGSFEKVGQVDEQLAVYRTNGGATTDYGIVVRQEQPVLPGVLLVRNVFDQYHLRNVACQKTGPTLTIRDPTSGQVLKEVLVSRFVYL